MTRGTAGLWTEEQRARREQVELPKGARLRKLKAVAKARRFRQRLTARAALLAQWDQDHRELVGGLRS